MISNLFQKYKGDRILWGLIFLISVISFLPVYSGSSNLEYVVGQGSVWGHFSKHAFFIIIGIFITFMVQRINFNFYGYTSVFLLVVVIFLLIITLYQGKTIDGANASRWLVIPGLSVGFQTSSLALMVLMAYLARCLGRFSSKTEKIKIISKESATIFFPIILIFALIAPANGSTALIILAMSFFILFIGGFPLRMIFTFILFIVFIISIALLIVMNSDFEKTSRINTWKSRIENFSGRGEESYQVSQAKIAIIQGGKIPRGPGKSALKQTLPQSASDFIFAIIVEEYGVPGAIVCISLYLILLYRINVIASKVDTFFGRLLVYAMGIPIVFQAFANMGVVVNLLPVTGQTLPILSYGGTSMWVTYMELGIILSVSREINKNKEKQNLQNEIS